MRSLVNFVFSHFGFEQLLFTSSPPTPPRVSPGVKSLHSISTFLNLPPELRVQIYRHIFQGSKIWVGHLWEKPKLWRGERWSVRFHSNRHWPMLFTCRSCYDEARHLFVAMTCFNIDSYHRFMSEGADFLLTRFAHEVSEFSRLNLVEIRGLYGHALQFVPGSISPTFRILAIPLFASIRTCVITHEFCQYVDAQASQVWSLPDGYLTESDVEEVMFSLARHDHTFAEIVTAVGGEEFEHVRHIDFLFIARITSPGHQRMLMVECVNGPACNALKVCVTIMLRTVHPNLY